MGHRYTESQARATKKYNNKTYKTYQLRLRLEDDAEIIKSIDSSRSQGMTLREWLNQIYKK